jgi:hypothetical protein
MLKNVFCTNSGNLFIDLFSCFTLLHQNAAVDCKITSTAGDKHFDKSPTKARHPRKIDLRARYWAFLFDNLRRAVDEIYVTCESDQSVVECKVGCALRLVIHLTSDAPSLAAFCWSFTSLFKVLINLICFSFHYFL